MLLIAVHVIVSVFLIAVILLQAGRGGGLSDTFGSSQVEHMFGTKSTNILTKATSVCAIGFIVTCLSLAVMSSHRSKSLLDRAAVPPAAEKAAPETPKTESESAIPSQPQGETNAAK